ncbi:MAG: hypothetical protein JKY66_00110 [Spongiibacteraceae bacterium]|nr:hypothetical protein [Spongiibacteraceae bacterium]
MDMNTGIAFGGIIVAVCALVLTDWTALSNRRQTRILNTPHLTPILDWGFDDEKNGFVAVSVKNDGLGPAKIISFKLTADGVQWEAKKLVAETLKGQIYRIRKNSTLAVQAGGLAGETIQLLRVDFPAKTMSEVDDVVDQFEAAYYEVEYQSYFGGDVTYTKVPNQT